MYSKQHILSDWGSCLMAPILGIWASSFAKNIFTPTGSYDALATYTVGSGGISEVVFSGIPTGGQYTHLQVRCLLRTTSGAYAGLQFNADTGNNYASHELYGNGSSAAAAAYTSRGDIPFFPNATSSATSTFTGMIIDVLDFSATTKYKTVRMLGGWDANGSGYAQFQSGLWQSTSSINQLRLFPAYGQSFTQYSQFALYGVKG